MFSWANRQLEKLSETLAPPPSTPTHSFLSALASNNEAAASAILNDPHQPLDPYALINPNRGMTAIHVAASHGAMNILRELVMHRGVPVNATDYQGCTPLHHAAQSTTLAPNTALAAVKLLVEELGANVLAKNSQNQTAYDLGSSQAVRGYLLPKQLQLETQECLDNGGRGLIPGIDMGGLKVNYANVAPPPVMGGAGGPPPMGGMAGPPPMGGAGMTNNNSMAHDPSAALMQPPPVRMNSSYAGSSSSASMASSGMTPSKIPQPPVMSSLTRGGDGAVGVNSNNFSNPPANNVNPAYPGAPVQTQQQPPQQQETQQQPAATGDFNQQHQPPTQPDVQPPVQATQQPETSQQDQKPPQQQPPVQTQPQTQEQQPPQQQQQQQQPPKSNNSTKTASAPNSGYALRGGNSNNAFVLNSAKYKPDGFHTSSNDKELQMKYGHVENDFEKSRKLAVPPPPISGGGGVVGDAVAVSGVGATGTGVNSGNAPYMGGYGGANPYSAMGAGSTRATGYIGGSGRARYPTYCAVSDSVSAPPSFVGMGAGNAYGAAPVVPSYSVFQPNNAAAAGNTGYNSGNAPSGQTQQWSGASQQNNSAYGATPASGNGYGAYGYDQSQQPQWNAQPNTSAAPSQYGAHAAAPASGAGSYGYGQQQQQYDQYSQGYAPSPQQPPQQQQHTQPSQMGADSAATMFATPSPQQQQQPPATADAPTPTNMFSTPQVDAKKTFPPSSGSVNLASPAKTSASAQDLFASPSQPSDASPAVDHFSSPPPAGTNVNDAPAPSAEDHFDSPPPPTDNAGAVSAADHFAAQSNKGAADENDNAPSAAEQFAAPPAIDSTNFSNAAPDEAPASTVESTPLSTETPAFDQFATNAPPSSTPSNVDNSSTSAFATTSSGLHDANSFFGSPPKEEASATNADASSFFGSAEKPAQTEASTAAPPSTIPSTAPVTEPVAAAAASSSALKSFGGLPPPPSLGKFTNATSPANHTTTSSRSSFLPPPPIVSTQFSNPTSPSGVENSQEEDGPAELMSEVSLNDS